MNRTPCERLIWNALPCIRKELAACMIHDFGLTQKETAKKLGVTPAAICQYLSKKRCKNEINDDEIIEEIHVSARRIIKKGEDCVVEETCRICKIIRSNGYSKLFFEK